jgi:hypothetical protein
MTIAVKDAAGTTQIVQTINDLTALLPTALATSGGLKVEGPVRASDGSGNPITSTASALDVNIKSGANFNGQAAMAGSSPVVIASDQSPVAIKGSTTGGATNLHFFSGTSTAAVAIKASAGTLYGIQAINTGASPIYMKIYNVAAASVVVGTTVPLVTMPIPTTATTGAGIVVPFPFGVAFGTAISFNLTGAAADGDTSAPIAGTTINVQFV